MLTTIVKRKSQLFSSWSLSLQSRLDRWFDSIKLDQQGVILLPIVNNAAEHVAAVTSSVGDELTFSLSVAVGSSIVS